MKKIILLLILIVPAIIFVPGQNIKACPGSASATPSTTPSPSATITAEEMEILQRLM
jgi:hypothetical protein